MTFVNKNEVRAVGMSRSGNHVIINWILSQAHGRTCFLNCVEPKSNPFQSARPIDGDAAVHVNYQSFDIEQERRGLFTEKDWLVYSYEDCFLGMVRHRDFEHRPEQWLGPSGNRHNLLVLRDPFNLFASRMRLSRIQITSRTTTRMWKQHAREFLGIRRYLPHDRIAVSYNRWVIDIAYRRSVAEQLGLTFTDEGFTRVPGTAGGSSFDGTRHDGDPTQMKVFHRWEHYIGDPGYHAFFDAEVFELSQRIFGTIPGTSVLLNNQPITR